VSANLELVQSLFERWERTGVYFGSAEWAHPDITLSLRTTNDSEDRNRDTQCMASANVDLVRSIYAAWERGDYSSGEWAHPDIEFVVADGPMAGKWNGAAGMAEGARSFFEAWEEFRIEPEKLRELDEEQVLVLDSFSARGKASGLDLDQLRAKGASLFCLQAGKVTRFVRYLNRENALAELDLPPEDSPRS
jgi:ketosteroid isomerase-like protein